MNTILTKKRLAMTISSCTLAMALGLSLSSPAAFASEDGGHKGSGGHSEGGHMQSGKGSAMEPGHNAGSSLKGMRQGRKDILDMMSEDEEESDRPSWAGQPGNEGKPGGGNAGESRKKGDEYGDVIVLQRNDDGSLVTTTENGDVITYAIASDGSLITIVNGEIPEGADVQEVEFGRLNIARSPEKVLDHSLAEALSKLDGGVLGETVTLDPSGRLVVDGSTIDSPLENLAIYEALLSTAAVDGSITLSVSTSKDGQNTTYTFTVPEDSRMELAASALAAASDKTGELTIDEVVGISSFLGVDDELATYLTAGTVDGYSREDTYAGVVVPVLEPRDTDGDGVIDTYVPISADVLTHVTFNDVDASSILNNDAGGIDIFTQMADDAVQVLEYVHDNALD